MRLRLPKPIYRPAHPTTATAPKPAPRPAGILPRIASLPARQPTPAPPERGGVELTARVMVDPTVPGRSESARPASAPAPEVEGSVGEYQPGLPPAGPENCASQGCGPECCTMDGCGLCCDKCGFCLGAEYLYLRPHFADDAAYEQSTATSTITTVTDENRVINFDEPYSSDYHLFVGYRNACGDEFRVGYWHITDDGNRDGIVTGDFLAGAGVAFQAPGGTQLTAAGETINTTSHMTLNMYDFEDFKRLNLPSLGLCCCPQWDVRWEFGLRVVDFKHTVDVFDPFETINNDTYFVGGGPKVGLEVRRQIGHSKVAAYVNTYAALLLGEARNRSTTNTPGVLETAVNMNINNGAEIVPDFNISLGLEWRPWCHTTITGGWMLEDFGNLGTAGATTCTTCSTTSGAIGGGNLSFDGLFLRAEHCF